MTDAQKRERHKEWLKSLGFSEDDWRRIRDAANRVLAGEHVPALRDLSVPANVAVLEPNPRYPTGNILGVITGKGGRKVKLKYWPMDDHDQRFWVRRRAGRAAAGGP